MGYATTQLREEAEVAKRFVIAVLAAMDRRPTLNAICYELSKYRTETGLSKLSLRREQDLKSAAKKLGLLLILTPGELCFVRVKGDEYNRTEYLTNAFRKLCSEAAQN